MSAVTGRIGGTPMRRIAELLAMPTTSGRCCVPSPRSPVSGPISGQAASGMRFRVRALHALVSCSSGRRRGRRFAGWRLPAVRLEQSPQFADSFGASAIPPVFPLLSLGHSLGAFPAPCGNCAALLHRLRRMGLQKRKDGCAAACALRVSVSRKSFVQRTQKTFSRPSEKAPLALGSGAHHHPNTQRPRVRGPRFLASLRARVSRGSSGQKPTSRKSSWHSTKTASA